jgi:O-antigen ligase
MMPIIILALFAVTLALTALYGVRRLMLALIVVRPSCDRLFDSVKLAFGGSSGPGAALNLLVIVLAFIAVLRRPGSLRNGLVIAWGSVLLAAGLSLLLSPNPAGGTRLFLTLVTYAAMLTLPFALISSVEDAVVSLKATLFSTALPTLLAVAELISTPAILMGDERLESSFTHPNILAFYLVGALTLILFLISSVMLELTRRQKQGLMAYAVLLLLLLLATKTRSAWIAMGLIFAGYALLVDRRGLFGVFALPLVLFIPGIGERILDLGGGNTNDAFANLNSYAWRQLLWAETWTWLEQNPARLFGHGLDLYVSYVPLFFSRGADPDGIGTHNAVFQIYFEMGAVGLAAFAMLFVTALAAAVRHMQRDHAGGLLFFLLIAAHMLMAYSDNLLDYLQFQWFFWFLTGVITASTPLLRQGVIRSGKRPKHSFSAPAPARA